jgi:dTMP kinase
MEITDRKGLFIAFEGGEGAGKTTQARMLAQNLRRLGREVLLTREPGGTEVGERLREIVLRPVKSDKDAGPPQPHLAASAELLLFLAARAQLVAEVISPALANNSIVVCDRFAASTIAYQGYGRGLDLDAIAKASELATSGLRPDLSILLDVPIDAGLSRKAEAEESDAIGRESRDFHDRVSRGFHHLAAADPQRWLIIDATQPIEVVARTVFERVQSLLSRPAS